MRCPEGTKHLTAEGNRVQNILMSELKVGLTGNELPENMLARARREGIPGPRVYSDSLGLSLHQPGPLIGLPWQVTVQRTLACARRLFRHGVQSP